MADGQSFWYVRGQPDRTVIIKVDPAANTSEPLLDTAGVREALAAVLGHEPPYEGIPFDTFSFTDDTEAAITFTLEGRLFSLVLADSSVRQLGAAPAAAGGAAAPRLVRKAFTAGAADVFEVPAPNGIYLATEQDDGLWLRWTVDGRTEPLIDDGEERYRWSVEGAQWSADGLHLAATKIDTRHTDTLPIVHWLKTLEEVEWAPYTKAGRPMARTELYAVDVLRKRAVRIDCGDDDEVYVYPMRWRPDGSELVFARLTRDFKRLDIMAADPETGSSRIVLTETQPTFIKGISGRPSIWSLMTPLGDGKRFLWISERDGWDHLYLYNMDGDLIRRLTRGQFPVLGVVDVDLEGGWVYFYAHGEPRLYDTHLYRVGLDGTGFARLTEATGEHQVQLSPSKRFFLDTHSTVARPPITELRAVDGSLVRIVDEADISELNELGWREPEEFVVKAADGETDLYGVIFTPHDLDESAKYPVLEYIYGGPQSVWTPHSFLDGRRGFAQAMAELGFVVYVVDGRGTTERGKAFQDVVYKRFGGHEIPDHVAALRQLGEARSYMDLDRVGIFGGSWGGYMTVRAMLTAPDVYRVGVAANPVFDLVDHPAFAIESYMGLIQDDPAAYAAASSHPYAAKLEGNLLIIASTIDVNAPFSDTVGFLDTLMKAGKPYDLIVLPEQNHHPQGAARLYYANAHRRYFTEHLHPDHS